MYVPPGVSGRDLREPKNSPLSSGGVALGVESRELKPESGDRADEPLIPVGTGG